MELGIQEADQWKKEWLIRFKKCRDPVISDPAAGPLVQAYFAWGRGGDRSVHFFQTDCWSYSIQWGTTWACWVSLYLGGILGPGHSVFRAPVIRRSPVEMKLFEPVDAGDRSVSQSCGTKAHPPSVPPTLTVGGAAVNEQRWYEMINWNRNAFFFFPQSRKYENTRNRLTRWHTLRTHGRHGIRHGPWERTQVLWCDLCSHWRLTSVWNDVQVFVNINATWSTYL